MNNRTTSYRDLIVWQKAINLVITIYKLTTKFPKTEKYGLISQMRRCAISIPSNIAEGRSRRGRLDYRRFLIIAYGSGAELETQIRISKELYLNENIDFKKADNLLSEVMKMLNKMIEKLT
jgi:four helix bundle protein